MPVSDRCSICARPLTDIVSKTLGIGPDCAASLGVKHSAAIADAIVARRRAFLAGATGETTTADSKQMHVTVASGAGSASVNRTDITESTIYRGYFIKVVDGAHVISKDGVTTVHPSEEAALEWINAAIREREALR